MKSINKIVYGLLCMLFTVLLFTACQKMERPKMRAIIPNPTPPAYSDLKSFWSFENNTTDQGENKLKSVSSNTSYVAGINGQALKIGPGGYLLLKSIGDSVKYSNEFLGLPADTLANLGSFTVAFWMNGVGPFTDGAQGLFAISHKTQFWGNLEVFLENYNNAADQTEAFLKIHMFNDSKAPGNGEQWNELKISGIFNKWSHIAMTYNAANSQFSLYANGVATSIANKVLDGGTYGKLKFKDFNGLVLGSFAFQTAPSLTNHGPEGWAKSFNGALDQFRIYNRSLSSAEITDLYTTKK